MPKKKTQTKTATKASGRKKKPAGLGKVPKKLAPTLEVKPLGATADGKLKLYEATVNASGAKLALGVITANGTATARRKAKAIAAKLFRF